ncbi:MAG TPA: pseudouridine synthase, partial [Alphaproteobacteria bacterium]|nr:pseudouridine synthase [Alphaproteobacteria bacterium]
MSDTPETADISEDGRERIAKRLARAGVCSRRDAEKLIAEGRVALNGTPVETPATLVGPDDEIVVDGNPVAGPEPTRLWRMHKPPGLVTTAKDPEGRPTVFDSLPPELPRVVSVGRLDLNSEGLLLLTNDGALSRFLEMPATGWTRRYRVRVHGYVDEAALKRLEGGITVAGVKYGPIEAALDRQVGANAWLTVGIKEGKNREVRKVLEAIGYTVSRLIRVAYGPFQLGKLAEGAVEEVPRRILREQIPAFFGKGGPALAPDRAKPAPAERTQRAVPGVVPEPKPVRAPEPEPRPRPMPRPRRAGMDEDEAPRRDRAAPAGRARYARADDEGAAQSRPTLRLRTAQTRRDDGSEPGYGVRRPRTRPDAERPRPQGPAERDAPRGRFGGERGEGGEGPRGRAERPRFERDGGDRPAPRGRSARPEREAAERGPPRSPSRGPARGENR